MLIGSSCFRKVNNENDKENKVKGRTQKGKKTKESAKVKVCVLRI